MKINITKLVPKNWEIKDLGKNIELCYKATKGKGPKSFVFPKEIMVDERFMEGIGLFLGDSDLNRKEKSHITYCSKDKDISEYALNFLKKYFLVDIKDITFTVQYKQKNKKLEEEWSNYLDIPKEKILTRFSDRHGNECIHIQVNGTVFRKMFEIVIGNVLKMDFMGNPVLRRAILRGLFAAEGNIGIDYKEKKDYISQITFDLHRKETHIEKIITSCLDIEGIKYKVVNRENRNSKEIIIFNWNNYKKFWEMNLFDLCHRKKNKFLEIMHNLKVSCFLEDDYRKELFNQQRLKQKEIAKIINSWQGNVSKTIKGELGLILEGFCKLNKRISYQGPLDKIIKINIGSLTTLENNEENKQFIEYLYNIKANQ
jgi:predicted XRE-type DNA-binding protein